MLPLILSYIAVGLFIQSLIVFVEVLINFKKPLVLKVIILFLAFGFAWRGLGYIFSYHYGYNRWWVELPQSLLAASAVSLFAYIYEARLKWFIISFGLLMVVIHLGYQFYYSFIIPTDTGIRLWRLPDSGNFIKLLKSIFTAFAFFINLRILLKILTKYKPQNIYFIQLRKWTLYLLIFQLLSGISFVLHHYSHTQNNIFYFFILVFNFLAVLFLLFRPKFLNRSNLKIKLGGFFDKKTDDEFPKTLFGEVFFKQLFYLNKDASVETLKKRLNVSSEALNNFLYTNYGLPLTDLVNKYRITYFIDLVNTGKYGNYTVDALAHEAGFSSRFHLYKSFRKYHGGTPSDFIRSVTD